MSLIVICSKALPGETKMTTETQHSKTYNSLIREYESVYDESMRYLNTVGHGSQCDENHLNNIVKMAKRKLSASEYDDLVMFTIELDE